MKYILILLMITTIIIFSACSAMTPIQDASNSTSQFGGGVYTGTEEIGSKIPANNQTIYRVFHRGTTGFTSLSAVRNSAEARADKFCTKQNKIRTTVSERHSNPPHILGNWPRIELLFVCDEKQNNLLQKSVPKYSKLEKIKKLLDNGTLSEEEFEIEKAKILKE